jgi:predicted RNA binding protein YcfA (HicA-like mRNA interferase family)
LPKLPKLTGKEVAKVAEKLGFEYSHTTGSHMVYKHPDGRRSTIPHHSGEEMGPGLLTKIIKKDFKITREDFLKLLKKH